jgi:succinate-semialdehyde dehydrogenase/glutarate-semialdehyde dehydrogenase
MSIQTTNPATNKVLKSFDEMTDEQVELQSKV